MADGREEGTRQPPRPWWRRLATGHDLRLVPAAGMVWLATLLGVQAGWGWAVAVGLAGALTGIALVCPVWTIRRPARVAGWALVCCGLITAVFTGSRLHADAANPLRSLADHGAAVRLRVEVAELPVPVTSPGFAGQAGGVRTVLVQADVRRLTIDGHGSDPGGTVLLLAPAHGWQGLLRGQQADAHGTLAPPQTAEDGVAVLRVRGSPGHVTTAPVWDRAANALRQGLRRAASTLPGDAAGLLPGLVVGDTTGVRPEVLTDFRAVGMAYLLAVGGYHFMIVCGAALWLLRRLTFGPRSRALLTGLVLLVFLEVAGPKPSVLRAAFMVGIGLLALGLGRTRATTSALAASMLVLLWWQPSFGGNLEFGLSVLATAGMLLLVRPTAEALARRRVPAGIAELIAVALVAHLATAPLIAGGFGQFSLAAVGANVLAEPAFVPAMLVGVLTMACSVVSAPLAGLVAHLAVPETAWLAWVAHHTAALPAAAVPWPTGWTGGLLLAGVIVAVVVALRSRRFRVLVFAVLAGVAVVLVPVRAVAPAWPPTGWAMVDCDVGQGDGEVLATSQPGRAVVVDTGPDEEGIDQCLSLLGVSRVPMVILSHLHADHAGGLGAVLRGRSVGAVAVGPSRVPAWSWVKVRQQTAAAHVPLVELSVGQQLRWPGLAVDVIGPAPEESWPSGDDPSGTVVNNASLVLRARTSAGTVLLSGDVELAAQAALLDGHADLRADILKIPHHGSRYSSPAFLDAVHARVAVASVGQGNPYGHPSPLTLDRLSRDGALVLRTDHDGDVAILPGPHGPVAVRRGDPRPPPHGSHSARSPP